MWRHRASNPIRSGTGVAGQLMARFDLGLCISKLDVMERRKLDYLLASGTNGDGLIDQS